MDNGLPVIASFWHGKLSWLERLCIDSFVRQGHAFHLYSYAPIAGLPKGAVWKDAADILAQDKLVFYKGRGTAGVFSDYFRMALLQREKGIWADADVFCVKPFANPPAFFVGFERPGSINGAVLLIPSSAPLLSDLISVFTDTKRPLFEPHLPLIRRLEVAAKRLAGRPVPPEYMQYGATGPFALTHYVRQRGLWDQVQPVEVFYPVRYEAIPALMRAGSDLPAMPERTLAIHIWRSQLTRRGRAGLGVPEAGSALARLCARHAIVPGP